VLECGERSGQRGQMGGEAVGGVHLIAFSRTTDGPASSSR
jgi:hypothetical protein